MTPIQKWVLWSRTAFLALCISVSALVSNAQCVTSGTAINFSTTGNTTTAGYTTTYVLTDNSGTIIQTVTSGFAAPATAATYRVYAVNYSTTTSSGSTAPTLTAGTNISAIGGSCVATSSSPIVFSVCAPAPATPVASVVNNPTSPGTPTGSVSLTGTGTAYPPSTPVSVTYTTSTGTAIFTGNTNGSGVIIIPNLPAGTYGPFVVSVNGSTPSNPSNTVTLVDPVVDPGCIAPGTTVSFSNAGNNTTTGYTTTYALTDANGAIISTSTATSVAAPVTSGGYRIYAVNYNTAAGNTAPTLTAGTSISAIGGTCVSVSSSPISFSVCPCNIPTPVLTAAAVTTCGGSDGTINATSTGATSFTLTGPAGVSAVNTTGSFTGLAVGSYTVIAGNGTCTSASSTTTLTGPSATPTPTVTVTQPTCSVAGSLTAVAAGATSFTLTNGTTSVVNTTGIFSSVAPGSYTVIASNGGCPATSSAISITAPTGCVPDLAPIMYALPSTQYGTTNFTVVVDVFNVEQTSSTGLITVYVTKDPLVTLSFNGGSGLVGGRPVQNSNWNFDGTSNAGFYILTTSSVIPGGDSNSFGLTGVLTPGNTQGTLTITTAIVGGSGGESRIDNNSDADRIDYFKK